MVVSLIFAAVAGSVREPGIQAVPFTQVHLHDGFWDKRIKLNREVTIWHEIRMCEETGRIDNFRAAVGEAGKKHEGYFFNDSDVYKVIEAAAYILSTEEDEKLEVKMDEWIGLIEKAQEPDGYLHTQTTASKYTDKPIPRWADDTGEHETYNVGHFYEAAVAYGQSTGKKKILDIALKNADLICATYHVKGRRHAPGHQEIEIGLVKLYEFTGKRKYLDQAKFFLDERGNKADRKAAFSDYNQDHLPVLEQDHAVGHSVRAAYQYCGMIDVGTRIGDSRYVDATKRIWDDVVRSKIYLTGGIGSSGSNEGFAKEYELPNLSGYAETCASIANILWNQRLFEATGDGKYIDVLERSLYNAFLSGYGADGKSFFYPNPLQSLHGADRQAWFACACCPPNVARMLPKVPELMYATDAEGVYVNLYATGDAEMTVKGEKLRVTQRGDMPTGSKSTLTVRLASPKAFTVRLRVPGWARNEPMPGDLYSVVSPATVDYQIRVAGKKVDSHLQKGYLEIQRTWRSGDEISVEFPVKPFWIKSNPKLKGNEGLVALQAGPFVYCAEDRRRGGTLEDELEYPPLLAKYLPSLKPLEPTLIFTGRAQDANEKLLQLTEGLRGYTFLTKFAARRPDGSVRGRTASPYSDHPGATMNFLPYFAWANRGPMQMQVWTPTTPERAMPVRAETLAALSSMSASEGSKGTESISDQLVPKSSLDQSLGNQHWWPKKGTTEWVEFRFHRAALVSPPRILRPFGLESKSVSAVKVYWFDDTGIGECKVPAAWRVLYKIRGEWKPVSAVFGVEKDQFNEARFARVLADAVRIEVDLQKGWSTGIHEVVIE